jgi:hypothetical protein
MDHSDPYILFNKTLEQCHQWGARNRRLLCASVRAPLKGVRLSVRSPIFRSGSDTQGPCASPCFTKAFFRAN